MGLRGPLLSNQLPFEVIADCMMHILLFYEGFRLRPSTGVEECTRLFKSTFVVVSIFVFMALKGDD